MLVGKSTNSDDAFASCAIGNDLARDQSIAASKLNEGSAWSVAAHTKRHDNSVVAPITLLFLPTKRPAIARISFTGAITIHETKSANFLSNLASLKINTGGFSPR